jgi:hypothetical protein
MQVSVFPAPARLSGLAVIILFRSSRELNPPSIQVFVQHIRLQTPVIWVISLRTVLLDTMQSLWLFIYRRIEDDSFLRLIVGLLESRAEWRYRNWSAVIGSFREWVKTELTNRRLALTFPACHLRALPPPCKCKKRFSKFPSLYFFFLSQLPDLQPTLPLSSLPFLSQLFLFFIFMASRQVARNLLRAQSPRFITAQPVRCISQNRPVKAAVAPYRPTAQPPFLLNVIHSL